MIGRAWTVTATIGAITVASLALAQNASPFEPQEPPVSDAYSLTADSLPSMSVPKGEVFRFDMTSSKIFAGTGRTVTVYVPAEYKPDKPACLYVGLDGLGFNVATVFDNLIAKHEMPATIAIGISAGVTNSVDGSVNPRYDRSFEFDSLSDRLAQFIIVDIIPAVESHMTQDGRKIVISANPNDRAIGGGSTGGIGAFTVAWERPDQFRRVFSAIGTYVGMRGGDQYPVLVRKTEPKPVRVSMQDGAHDEWGGGPEMGDWWMSNQTMQRALSFAGYEVQHVWGTGTHNGNQAAAVFPQAMVWLWSGWPAPVHAGVSENPVLRSILKPTVDWQVVAANCPINPYIAPDAQGKIFYGTSKGRRPIQTLGSGGVSHCGGQAAVGGGPLTFDASGHVYEADNAKRVITVASTGEAKSRVMATDLRTEAILVRQNGDLYATSRDMNGSIWLVHQNGTKVLLESGLKEPSGLALSPDGLWMFVTQSDSRYGYSYRVKGDGTLDAGEPFYDFYVPAWADNSEAGSVWMDKSGLAYVATRIGVQIFDRNGRVAAILPLPDHAGAVSLCFGGEGFHTLYVSTGDKIYARQLEATGAPSWEQPSTLPPWGAG